MSAPTKLRVWDIIYDERDPRVGGEIVPEAPFMTIDDKFVPVLRNIFESTKPHTWDPADEDKHVLARLIANPTMQLEYQDCLLTLYNLDHMAMNIATALSGGFRDIYPKEHENIDKLDCAVKDLLYYTFNMRCMLTYVATHNNVKINYREWDDVGNDDGDDDDMPELEL
jgi:hypothetical protein